MKIFNVRYNIGKARYVISYHDGIKTHNDGSRFYDLCIFKNKKNLNKYITFLKSTGYIES
jgi:hypothetical protein